VEPHLQEVAEPALQELADALRATTALTIRDANDAVVLLVRAPATTEMHLAYRSGLRHPLSVAASGIAILAGNPARDGERPEVTVARARGWARSTGELLPGATGVGAPIVGSSGDAQAAVSAVWVDDRDEEAMAAAVRDTAALIARSL
jgi:DNA-binding IclR family transcriptional regulator